MSTLEVHDTWPAFEIRDCFDNCNIPIHGVLVQEVPEVHDSTPNDHVLDRILE